MSTFIFRYNTYVEEKEAYKEVDNCGDQLGKFENEIHYGGSIKQRKLTTMVFHIFFFRE